MLEAAWPQKRASGSANRGEWKKTPGKHRQHGDQRHKHPIGTDLQRGRERIEQRADSEERDHGGPAWLALTEVLGVTSVHRVKMFAGTTNANIQSSLL